MLSVSSRTPFQVPKAGPPTRPIRPKTDKIIFLSLEGAVTEEGYFKCLMNIYSECKSKIQFVSVKEDIISIPPKRRSKDQNQIISKSRPKQLLDLIEQYKEENDEQYEFDKYPDDEFWIVTDVDKNWSNDIIDLVNNKTYLDEWKDTVAACQDKGYHYAISNPFFEMWLLLHHDEPNDEDKSFAVTNTHSYQSTTHFRERLQELGVPLKRRKHIKNSDYNAKKVTDAIIRAQNLHKDINDLYPKYFATTVYMLVQKIADLAADEAMSSAEAGD